MNQFKEIAGNDSQLNKIRYERTISVSSRFLSKFELVLISVLSSCLYFVCSKDDNEILNKKLVFAGILYLLIFIWLLERIFWGVKTESIFIVKNLGLQKITVYHSNLKSSVFIPWHSINDVIINEAIVMQKVIYYLAVLVKADKDSNKESIIPFFIHSRLRLSELKEIYRRIQLILE